VQEAMTRIYLKEGVCIGCHLCEIYCIVEHSKSKDVIKAFKKESPRALSRIRVEEKGALSLAVQCRYCDEPPCVYSCLTGALSKDADSGVVSIEEQKCIGCWTCVMVCPYGAIIPDFSRKKIAKCDLCYPREIPVCVANCPNEALVLGSR